MMQLVRQRYVQTSVGLLNTRTVTWGRSPQGSCELQLSSQSQRILPAQRASATRQVPEEGEDARLLQALTRGAGGSGGLSQPGVTSVTNVGGFALGQRRAEQQALDSLSPPTAFKDLPPVILRFVLSVSVLYTTHSATLQKIRLTNVQFGRLNGKGFAL